MREIGVEWIKLLKRIWIDGYLKLKEQATAITGLTVADDHVHVYAKDNGAGVSSVWYKDDADVEHQILATTGVGVAGQVAFFDGVNSITGEDNLFWDATNNRLGVGTATPTDLLHVNGVTRVGSLKINSSGFLGSEKLYVGGDVVIDTGLLSVLIGSASTKGQIIKGAAAQSANLQEWQNSSADALTYVDPNGNVTIGSATRTNPRLQFNDGGTSLYLRATSGDLQFLNNSSAIVAHFGQDRNVGIGTGSVTSLGSNIGTLDIRGRLGTAGGGVAVGSASTQFGYMYGEANNTIVAHLTGTVQLQPNAGTETTTQISVAPGGWAKIGPVSGVVSGVPLHLTSTNQNMILLLTRDSTGHNDTDGMRLGLDGGGHALIANQENGVFDFGTNGIGAVIGLSTTKNLIIGADSISSNPGTGSKGIVFEDGTALASLASNTAGFYANDVSGTVNTFTINEAGAVTQLSGGMVLPSTLKLGGAGNSYVLADSSLGFIVNNNADTINLMILGPTGNVSFPSGNLTVNSGTATVISGNASTVVATIKGAASQSANLQEWQNSSGGIVNELRADGSMLLSGITGANVGLVVQSAAGHTVDLQAWKNSSGNALMAVENTGRVFIAPSGTSATGVGRLEVRGLINQDTDGMAIPSNLQIDADANQEAGIVIQKDNATKWQIYTPPSSNDLAFYSGNLAAEPFRMDGDAGVFILASTTGFIDLTAPTTKVFKVPTDNTDPTSGGGAATGRIPIHDAAGNLRYIPYY
jgi:hypothetical protein